MRLFITSYQKSGTHQIMPIFGGIPDVVNRGHNEWIDAPDKFGLNKEINWEGVSTTVNHLKSFKTRSSIAFGHIAYTPEYAQVLQETDTRVIFNFRDPRDVIVAEYANAKGKLEIDSRNSPLWNFFDKQARMRIFHKPDPIPDLIELAGARWKHWLGWLDHDFVLPIKYEDLRLNPVPTAERIFQWAEPVGCPDVGTIVIRIHPRPKNPTFRRGVPGEWKERFTDVHKRMAEDILGYAIIKLGYVI